MDNIDTLEAVLNFTTQLTNEKYELEQQLVAETKNKQQFERDWLECCDALSAAQDREKVLLKVYAWMQTLDSGECPDTVYIPVCESVKKLRSDS